MSGWIALTLLIALSAAALYLSGLRGALFQMAAAALMAGAAGYALHGRPGLGGSPGERQSNAAPLPMAPLRHAFFGQFVPAERWLVIADSFSRRGNTAEAVGVLRSAVREHPGDPALWIGLGNTLVDHAGVITPAAELAYARAQQLAPGHPAARFFFGLGLARSGARAGAIAEWRRLLADAPADASWRPLVEDAIAALASPPSPPGRR